MAEKKLARLYSTETVNIEMYELNYQSIPDLIARLTTLNTKYPNNNKLVFYTQPDGKDTVTITHQCPESEKDYANRKAKAAYGKQLQVNRARRIELEELEELLIKYKDELSVAEGIDVTDFNALNMVKSLKDGTIEDRKHLINSRQKMED